jgi:hypothetical protein
VCRHPSQAVRNRVLKRHAVGIVLGVETLLFDKLPQALNEIEIGGIRGEEEQLDPQGCRERLDQGTALIAGIV